MSTNPHVFSWTNPTEYTDGSAYTQADNAGYQLILDGAPAVGIPLAWGTSFDASTLAAYQALKRGSHTAALQVVDTAGEASAPSNSVTFQIEVPPNPPTNLAIA